MIMNYRNVKLVMFDLDGTLINTMQGFADVAAEVINQNYGIDKETARKDYLRTSGIPFFQQLEELFPNNKINPKASDEFEEKKLETFYSEQFPRDTINCVNKLREKNILVAVSSNNYQEFVDKFITDKDLVFDYVLGFKEGFAKGKDHFDFLIKSTKLSKENILFIGDSLKDAERAFKNGVKFIGKSGTFTKEEFLEKFPHITVINRLTQLIYILIH